MDTDLHPILLAEDDPRDAELTLQALREHHLANRVGVVRDGVETLEYLRGTVRAGASSGRPAVMLTSSREGPDLQAAYVLGGSAYVVKLVGAFWALLNEPAPVGQR